MELAILVILVCEDITLMARFILLIFTDSLIFHIYILKNLILR
jgi:hypothetical protein